MDKHENQRVRLTKKLFRDSLIALLRKKKIYQITVSELCAAAELNRSSFYKHYGNVYDVLAELEEDFLAQIRSCVDQIEERGSGRTAEPVYRLMRHIRDNADAYSLLLDNSIDENFSFSIIRQALEFVKGKATETGYGQSADSLFEYIMAGSVAVIRNWMAAGMPAPPEEIAELIYTTALRVLEPKSV